MIIEMVDAYDDAAFAQWFRPFHAAEVDSWPGDPGWREHELRVLYRDQSSSQILIGVARDADGAPIGCLDVSLPRMENEHLAFLVIAVDPAHRRRGVGRALLERAEQLARQHGRRLVVCRSEGRVGRSAGAAEFARAAGYAAAREESFRELRLPVAPEHLNDLEARCHPLATRYELVTWLNTCPEALVAGRVELQRRMSVDAPRGAIDLQEEDWDAARLRAVERNQQEMGSDLVATAVVHRATGALAGFCEVVISRAEPEVGYQLDTIVAPAHRGHRLGLLLKIASTRLIMERSPATQRVKTENAVSNAPMIAVNDQLGYQLAGRGTAWQKELA